VVFIAYLVIGLAMPVLPLHVHLDLGLSTFVVGLVSGSQFAASFFSRMWAGHQADKKGSKHAVVTGLLIAAVSGLLYLLSLRFAASPVISVGMLLLGRAVLGVAESLIVTGALSWGLALMGPQNTGKVMSWVGTSLYAAFAVGAPAGTALYPDESRDSPLRYLVPPPQRAARELMQQIPSAQKSCSSMDTDPAKIRGGVNRFQRSYGVARLREGSQRKLGV
jgi:MFS family permease